MAAPVDAPDGATPIRLTPTDVALLDAPPILCLVRLDRPVPPGAVAAAFARHLPRRLTAAVRDRPGGPVLVPGAGTTAFGTVDVAPGTLARVATAGVPVRALAPLGLGTTAARDPVCTLTHVRDATGDALALRLSHAAGDGLSLLGLLGPLLADLAEAPTAGPPGPGAANPGPVPSAVRPGADEGRVLSVLPLSTACDDEIVGVGADRPGQSAVVRRIAVVARRLAPHVLPPDADLRLRIPIDLRHRGLGIPRGAVGNHWHDALAVIDGPVAALPPVAGVADAVDAALSDRLAPLRPEHVEHREDESLRLLVDHGGEPIRRGVDLVFSCLPAPVWPGVRAVHVLGSASLGVVHVRGARSVDVVTEGPLPGHVTAV